MAIYKVTVPAPRQILDSETREPMMVEKLVDLGNGRGAYVKTDKVAPPVSFKVMRRMVNAPNFQASMEGFAAAGRIMQKLDDCPCAGGEELLFGDSEMKYMKDAIEKHPTTLGYMPSAALQIMDFFKAFTEAPEEGKEKKD